jgi:hypothetical protein
VRQRVELLRRQVQLHWKSLGVAAGAGVLVLLLVWLAGPGLFGAVPVPPGTVVSAEVTKPVECAVPDAEETVKFPLNGTEREGSLSACGHDKGERVDVMVPAAAGDGMIEVETAKVLEVAGSGASRPLGLLLVVLACFAGALYAAILLRDPPKAEAKVKAIAVG